MKKTNSRWIVILLVLILSSCAFEEDNVTQVLDSYAKFRSDDTQTEQEDIIKDKIDTFMNENFNSFYRTSWFDSISATSAVINDYGTLFIVQSKDNASNQNAEQFLNAALSFFNDKTIDTIYRVDEVILLDSDFNVIKEVETINW